MLVRAVDQQPLTQGFGATKGAPSIDKVDADDQAFAAHLADEIEAGRERLEAARSSAPRVPNVVEQLFVFDHGEKFERCRADQRAAAESGAVEAGAERRGEFFAGDKRTQRQVRLRAASPPSRCRATRRISDMRSGVRCGQGPIGFRLRSALRRVPWSARGHALQNSFPDHFTPPSPWIGSMTMAQTESSNLASRSATSLKRTNSTPGTRGSKGSRYLAVEVIERAPMVRP